MANPSNTNSGGDTLTVAKVTEEKSGDATITFLESQRFYTLEHKNKNFKSCIDLLRESENKKISLLIAFTQPNGDTIKNVEKIRHRLLYKRNHKH